MRKFGFLFLVAITLMVVVQSDAKAFLYIRGVTYDETTGFSSVIGTADKNGDKGSFKVYCQSTGDEIIFQGDIVAGPSSDGTFGVWELQLPTTLGETWEIWISDGSGVAKGGDWFTFDPPLACSLR